MYPLYLKCTPNFYYFTCLRSSRFDADANGSWINYGWHECHGDVDIKKRELLQSKFKHLIQKKTRILIKFCYENTRLSLHPNCSKDPLDTENWWNVNSKLKKSQLRRRKRQTQNEKEIKTNYLMFKNCKVKKNNIFPRIICRSSSSHVK